VRRAVRYVKRWLTAVEEKLTDDDTGDEAMPAGSTLQ
jgi:hypothetical protein